MKGQPAASKRQVIAEPPGDEDFLDDRSDRDLLRAAIIGVLVSRDHKTVRIVTAAQREQARAIVDARSPGWK